MTCPKCKGRGYSLFPSASLWSPDEVEMVKEPCDVCGGTGEVCDACGGVGTTSDFETACPECDGTGEVERTLHDTGHPDMDCPCVCSECEGSGKKPLEVA